jgi:coenzyme F420-reducing hydrogenase beta subunit
MSHTADADGPLMTLAARVPEFMEGSSSGGVFPALASKVTGEGGVVYGAVMNPDLTVSHADACDAQGVERMRGSKYVQSELYASFEDVKYELSEGRKVMFTGTPCQIAGLKSYIGNDEPDLLLVDCACHGVPGPGLWEKYVKALSEKYGMQINDIRFRAKGRSWRKYDFVISDAEKSVVTPHSKDPYMLLFLQDMTLRPSCYQCPFRKGRSGSDLTLADLWNVSEAAPEMDDDRGVSLILVNSEKGRETIAGLSAKEIDPLLALGRNGAFAQTLQIPQRRNEFFQSLHSAKDLIGYMKGFVVRTPLHKKIYRSLHTVLSKIKRRIIK